MPEFITPDTIEQTIRSIDESARDIRIVTVGTNNVIGIVDNDRVFRFPRNEQAVVDQRFEAAILQTLAHKLTVPVPELLKVETGLDYVVVSCLNGEHLAPNQVQALPEPELRSFIVQLLTFSVELNDVVAPDDIENLEREHFGRKREARSWDGYLTYALKDVSFPGKPWLERLAVQQFNDWHEVIAGSTLPLIVVHDDLQLENILFKNNQVSAILDFADTTTGTIAQELRQLMRISDHALEIAAAEYENLTSITIPIEEIRNWSITQELAAYCRWLAKGDLTHPSLIRSQSNLRAWLPDFPG